MQMLGDYEIIYPLTNSSGEMIGWQSFKSADQNSLSPSFEEKTLIEKAAHYEVMEDKAEELYSVLTTGGSI